MKHWNSKTKNFQPLDIAAKNPSKFNLTNSDIEDRRQFIQQTRDFVQVFILNKKFLFYTVQLKDFQFKKKTKKTYSVDLDDTNLLNTSSAKKSNNNTGNINIRIPDIISNTNAKQKNYSKLENDDDSDYELDTRKSNFAGQSSKSNSNNNSQSVQMQHEVSYFPKMLHLNLYFTIL